MPGACCTLGLVVEYSTTKHKDWFNVQDAEALASSSRSSNQSLSLVVLYSNTSGATLKVRYLGLIHVPSALAPGDELSAGDSSSAALECHSTGVWSRQAFCIRVFTAN